MYYRSFYILTAVIDSNPPLPVLHPPFPVSLPHEAQSLPIHHRHRWRCHGRPHVCAPNLSHPILHALYKLVIYDQRASAQNADGNAVLWTAGATVALSVNWLYPLYALGFKDAVEQVSIGNARFKLWRTSRVVPLEQGQRVENAVASEHRLLNEMGNVA